MMLPSVKTKTFLLFVLVLLSVSTRGYSRRLTVPLPVDICPTSSFGSWRYGHLHAGLDFSTGGVTGVPVLAVDSCWVWRIRLWNGGYGKALYTQLADGKIAVYGHLSRFIPEIEAMVEQEQDLKASYEVELYFEPSVFRFLPGDTIAFSGETGSGPPHLHFELRSGRHDHLKINPVPQYMDIAESFAPRIDGVLVEPLAADASVDGRNEAVRVTRAGMADTLVVAGEFGLSVSAVDHVQCGRTVKPIVYDAWIDDRHIWHLNLDTFPFAKAHFVDVVYQRHDGRTYVRLHDPYGLDLRGFDCLPAYPLPMQSRPTPGCHEVRIVAADAWGNTDSMSVPIVYGTIPEFRMFALEPDTSGTLVMVAASEPDCSVDLAFRRPAGAWQAVEPVGDSEMWVTRVPSAEPGTEVVCTLTGKHGLSRTGMLGTASGSPDPVLTTILHGDFVEVLVETAGPPLRLPSLRIREASSEGSINVEGILQPAGRGRYRAVYHPKGSGGKIDMDALVEFENGWRTCTGNFTFGKLVAGSSFWYVGEAHRIRLSVPAGYGSSTLVRLSDEAYEDTIVEHKGFERTLGRIVIDPAGGFFNEKVEILVVPRDLGLTPGAALFAERGRPVFLGTFDSTGACTVRLRRLENLLILEDRTAPVIDLVPSLRLRPNDGRGIFRGKVTDSGSGLDVGSLKAYVDGDVAIVGYDPDTGRIEGRTRKPLQKGIHKITLEARDRVGNSATQTVGELQ